MVVTDRFHCVSVYWLHLPVPYIISAEWVVTALLKTFIRALYFTCILDNILCPSESNRSVSCQFENRYACGYDMHLPDLNGGVWRRRYDNGFIFTNGTRVKGKLLVCSFGWESIARYIAPPVVVVVVVVEVVVVFLFPTEYKQCNTAYMNNNINIRTT